MVPRIVTKTLFVLLSVALSTAAFGAGQTDTAAEAPETVLNLISQGQERGLTGWARGGNFGMAVTNSLEESLPFDTLLLFDPTYSELRPHIAERWEASDDNLVYTFQLRQDVFFHDGEQMHADDLVTSVHLGLGTGKAAGRTVAQLAKLKGALDYREGAADSITGIEIVDDFTVRFTLTDPSYTFLTAIAAQPIMPEHLLSDDLRDNRTLIFQSDYWQHPIATGPFKFSRSVPGDFAELLAYDDYFLGRPQIDKVIIWERDPIIAAEDGKLDFMWGRDPAQIDQLLQTPGMTGYPVENGAYKRELWSNMEDGTMGDLRLRQAIAYAINRAEIAAQFFNGYANVWHTVVPPTFWSNRDLPQIPYDPDRSRQLLSDAGWDPDTELTLIYYYTDPQTSDFMALIQSYLAEVGIKVSPRLVERDVGRVLHDKTMSWQLAYGARNSIDTGVLHQYATGAGNSPTDYSNPTIDRMLAEMEASLDTAERKRLGDEIQAIIMDDMPTIPLYATKEYILHSERLKMPVKWLNRYSHPFDLRFHEWTIEP